MYSLFPKKNIFGVQKFFSKEMYLLLLQRKMNSKIEYIQGIKVFLKRKYFRSTKFSPKVNVSGYKSSLQKICNQSTENFLKRECIRSTRVFLERKCIHRRRHGFVTESEDGASSPPDEKKLSTCG